MLCIRLIIFNNFQFRIKVSGSKNKISFPELFANITKINRTDHVRTNSPKGTLLTKTLNLPTSSAKYEPLINLSVKLVERCNSV